MSRPSTVACPHCRMSVVNDGRLAGQIVNCPGCQGQFQMPVLQAMAEQAQSVVQPITNVIVHNVQTQTVGYGRPQGSCLAAILSLFIPGLGQLIKGEGGKAIGHFVVAVLCWFILLGWVIHLYSAYDAGR